MGKATIVSGGADGLYTVRLDYGKAKRDAAVVRILARLGEIEASRAQAQTMLDEQQAVEDAQATAVTAAIDAYVAATQAVPVAAQAITAAQQALAALLASPSATPAQKAAAEAAVSAAKAAYTAAQKAVKTLLDAHTKSLVQLVAEKRKTAVLLLALETLQSQQKQLEKDLAYWQGLVLEEDVPAWCADLTESATGNVATLELPGENKLLLIEPAAPAYVAATHGNLSAREVQSDAQVFFNAAILPGWQKYKPTYRRGTITAINEDADTADVLLEVTDKSSAQKLVINKTPTLEAVPVQYMTCNSGAFEVGDRCVVKFTNQDWAQPKIVGFVDNPKSCGAVLACVPSSSAHRLGYTPPLPNYLGGSAQWVSPLRYPMPAGLTPGPHLGQADMHPGTTTWSNPDILIKGHPVVVSWRGDDHRYSRYNNWNYPNPPWEEGFVTYFGNANQWPDSAYVWVNGFRVYTPVRKIIAAALYRPAPVTRPERVVLRICTDEFPIASGLRQLAFIDCEKAGADPTLTLWDLCNFPSLVITASTVGPLSNGPVIRYIQQRPHYNQAATKIAAVFEYNAAKFAATVDVVSGALVKFFEPTYAQDYVSDQTDVATYRASDMEADPPTPGSCSSFTMAIRQELNWTSQVLHAVDFLGDQPVALYAEITGGYVSTFGGTFTTPGGSSPAASSDNPTGVTGSYLAAPTRAIKIVHTRHGQLLEKTYSGPGAVLENVLGESNGVMLGDLSRNMFAFGVAKTDVVRTATRVSHIEAGTQTEFNPQYEFTFWHAAATGSSALVKVPAGVDGGYAFDRPIAPVTTNLATATEWGNTRSIAPGYSFNASETVSEHLPSSLAQGQTTLPIFAKYYQHAGVDPTGRVGYFGCGQYHSGMETMLRVKNSELVTVPAYAPGAYPVTLMAPVFYAPLRPSPPPP